MHKQGSQTVTSYAVVCKGTILMLAAEARNEIYA